MKAPSNNFIKIHSIRSEKHEFVATKLQGLRVDNLDRSFGGNDARLISGDVYEV